MNPQGIITTQSKYPVNETINRLASFLQQHGATIYARIDQQAELANVGINILPLQFILFGNPKAGGLLMKENPLTALDLPLKIIAWEDDQRVVRVAYNEASYLQDRYGLSSDLTAPLNLSVVIEKAL